MNKEILLVIENVSNEKNVSKDVIIDAIESALASAVVKKYRLDKKCLNDIKARVSTNRETGEYTTFRIWELVEEIIEDLEDQQILLEEAIKKNDELTIGDFYEEEVDSIEFGRIVAQTAKNVIVQKVENLSEAEY